MVSLNASGPMPSTYHYCDKGKGSNCGGRGFEMEWSYKVEVNGGE